MFAILRPKYIVFTGTLLELQPDQKTYPSNMACLNKMLLALTIIAAGMIIGTATKAVEIEEYREVMGQGMDPSAWKMDNYGTSLPKDKCQRCYDSLGSCNCKECKVVNGVLKVCRCC